MKKQAYHISKKDNGNVFAEEVSGYVVEKTICGRVLRFGARKDGRESGRPLWTVDELATGCSVNPGFKFGKRAEALAYIEDDDPRVGKSLAEKMAAFLTNNPSRYDSSARVFEYLKRTGKPMSAKEHAAFMEKEVRSIAAELPKDVAAPKPTGYVVTAEGADGTAYIHRVACKKRTTAEARMARIADAPVEIITCLTYRGTRDGDKLLDRLKDELKMNHDTVITLVGTPGSCLRTIWESDERKASETMKKSRKKQPKKGATQKTAKKPAAKKTIEKTAAIVSLETMKAWCAERENVIATQKREGASIRVYGETKPYREELLQLGFRWTPNKQFWYAKPTA